MTLLLVGAVAHLVGCVDDELRARRGWVHHALVQDNLIFLEREPESTAAKFEKMASQPYFFFRGASSLFVYDSQDPGQADLWATRYGTSASAYVASMGDPHPENLGTFRWADGTMSVEYNDFDGALFGPYWLGVRRLATGFGVLMRISAVDGNAQTKVIEAVARGYVDQITTLATGGEPILLGEPDARPATILDDLVRRARRDGDARQNFTRYTEVVDGRRRMRLGDLEPPDGRVLRRRLTAVSEHEQTLIEGLLQDYPSTLVDPTIVAGGELLLHDAARRFGAGVSSYPGLRYYALVSPSATPGQQLLVEIKELRDPVAYRGLDPLPPRPFADNGERLVSLRRAFHESPTTDPWLGWASEGPLSFRVRHLTRYQRNISVDRIVRKLSEGKWSTEDVVDLAYQAGALLARGHARASGAGGRSGLSEINAALGGDQDGFVAETTAAASQYVDRVFSDHALLVGLLADHGPLLGYRPRAHWSRP